MKPDKIGQQAGEVVEQMVNSYLKAIGGRGRRRRRGLLRPLFGLLTLAGGAAAVYYAQADEQTREEAGRKVSELADQVLDQISALKD